MNYVLAFLSCGLICLIGQFIMDKFKLLPVHITVIFVILGAFLEFGGIYDKLLDIGHVGLNVPISSFGHTMAHYALEQAKSEGLLGLMKGLMVSTAPGVMIAILSALIISLIFKPKN